MGNETIQIKSLEATKRHLKIIEDLKKGKEVSYDYLETCWVCGNPITFFDRLTFNCIHSFEGNSHRRDCSHKSEKLKQNG